MQIKWYEEADENVRKQITRCKKQMYRCIETDVKKQNKRNEKAD